MTPFEQSQPQDVFIDAGRNAFLLGVSPDSNPYKDDPFRRLWAKGHTDGKYHWEAGFIKAGKAAFTAGLTLEDNPYRTGVKRALWGKGWWKAKHRADDKIEAQKRYRPSSRREPQDRARVQVVSKDRFPVFYGPRSGRFQTASPNA